MTEVSNTTSASSLNGFIEIIENLGASKDTKLVTYRGHSRAEFKLTPSVLRGNFRHTEGQTLRDLIAQRPRDFREDQNTFDRLVRAQHYSLKTRLLDISFNPLVALYFCCRDDLRHDGSVVVFTTAHNKIRYFDSDSVSLLANLAFLSSSARGRLAQYKTDADLRSSPEAQKLLKYVRREKPYFQIDFGRLDLRRFFIVKAKQNSDRIVAQQGAFILFGLASEMKIGAINSNSKIDISNITIPADAKYTIMKQLDMRNVNTFTMFPGLDAAAVEIHEKSRSPYQ